jgi:integrase
MDRGSPVQANRTLAAVRRLCGWAVERGLISTSPCVGIRAPAAETSRDRTLADDELAAVWRGAAAIGWPFGPVIQLLILTGARRGEISGMRWAEIDVDAKLWTLPKERSKNGIAHAVPLSNAALAILETLPRIESESGYVFTTSGRVPVDGFGAANARIDHLLPGSIAAWRLHDLRRTFASGCARLGVAIHVVEKLLNHSSGTFRGIVSVYQKHDFGNEQRAAMELWARHVEGLSSGTPGNVVALTRR